MTVRTHAPLLLAAVALTTMLAPNVGHARSKRGVKKAAMKRFSASSREVSVIATAKASSGGAAIVRLQNSDVPTCYLLVLNAPPKRATKIVKAFRTRVCAAYDKHARAAKLRHVPLTTRLSAWRVFVLSKRVDALAKGQETSRFWALYSDAGAASKSLFERTSTSFESKTNSAYNQAEVCQPPAFPVGDEPTTLTMTCDSESMLQGIVTRKRNVFQYAWKGGRFESK